MSNEQTRNRILPLTWIPEQQGYQWLSENSLRHLVRDAKCHLGQDGEIIPGNGLL